LRLLFKLASHLSIGRRRAWRTLRLTGFLSEKGIGARRTGPSGKEIEPDEAIKHRQFTAISNRQSAFVKMDQEISHDHFHRKYERYGRGEEANEHQESASHFQEASNVLERGQVSTRIENVELLEAMTEEQEGCDKSQERPQEWRSCVNG
jgi:hypothetical protein